MLARRAHTNTPAQAPSTRLTVYHQANVVMNGCIVFARSRTHPF